MLLALELAGRDNHDWFMTVSTRIFPIARTRVERDIRGPREGGREGGTRGKEGGTEGRKGQMGGRDGM